MTTTPEVSGAISASSGQTWPESNQGQQEAQSRLLSTTVCLEMTFSRLGTRRSAGTSQIEVEADKDMLYLAKDIISSKELKAIVTADNAFKKKLRRYAVPTKMFRGGIYPIPAQLVPEIDQEIQTFLTEREQKVSAFLEPGPATDDTPDGTPSIYEQRIQEAQRSAEDGGLGVLFNPRDYPPAPVVKRKFGVSVQYTNWGVPRALETISRAIFQRESEKSANRIAEAQEEIRAALRAGTKQLLDHLKDRLTPDEDGKSKKFHYTAVENLKAWMSTFDARNITDDAELADVVAKARLVLENVNPKSIRENTDLRQYVLTGMSEVTALLDPLVVSAENDRVFMDDDEVAA